jgi:Ca2+/Na+ antiporter
MLLVLLSVLAAILLPAFTLVSIVILRNVLPLWFLIIETILASLALIFLVYLFLKTREENTSRKNHILY